MNREELLKNAKQILFNTEMVQAILEGRKTVTRRVCKEIANYKFSWGLDREPYIGDYKAFTKTPTGKWDWVTMKNVWLYDLQTKVDESKPCLLKPKYKVGDIIYVRETWSEHQEYYNNSAKVFAEPHYIYKADGVYANKWRPSIHMPKEAARIFLKVTDVRVERLQDMTEEQAEKEGVKAYGQNNCSGTSARIAFAELWDSISETKFEWRANPWVWVIEFERVEVENE